MTQAEATSTTQVMVNAKSSDGASGETIQPGSVRVSMKDNSPATTNRTSTPMNGSNGHFAKSSTAEPLQVVFKDIYLSLRSTFHGDETKEKNGSNKSADKSNPPQPSKNQKVILNKCTGVFEPGRVCAVLGASGAGKTSLIQLISGHRTWPSSSVVKSEGKIFINGEEAGEGRLRQLCAFVYQDDVMYESLTVREIITLAAMLRLPQSLSDDEKRDRIESVIDMLALRKCAETRVGSGGTSGGVGGISGGEKRRLSMAIEMINNPSILFLDEPTSGLDTYTAFNIVRILKSIAVKYNRTIVFTIHQPSSDIYHLFDDIMLLANGRMVYQGDAHRVVDYVAHHGYQCPEYVNIADYLFMNVLYDHKHLKSEVFSNKKSPSSDAETAQKESERKKLTESERERMNGLLDAWTISSEYQSIINRIDKSPYKNGIPKTIQTSQAQASFKTQFKLLTERVVKNLLRNRLALRASAGQMTFFAIFTGLIYLQISMNQGGVQDRMGSLFFFSVQGVMAAMSMNLATFSVERDIFLREFNSGMYTLPAFFFSRVLAEIPFRIIFVFIYTAIAYWMIGYQATFENFITFYFLVLGVDTCGQNIGKAIATGFPNINVALAIGPAMMMPMMLFAGLYINLKKIPQYFRWLSYLSPMRWGYVGLSRLEYPGLQFSCEAKEICRYQSGDDVLRYLGVDDQPDPWYCVLILFSFALFFSGLAYFLLYRGTRKLA